MKPHHGQGRPHDRSGNKPGNRPTNRADIRPARSPKPDAPVVDVFDSPRHDDLRAHLAELYARLVAVPVPPDQLIGRFFRLRPELPPAARGFLSGTVYALLRRRLRTLLLVQWAARDNAMFEWDATGAVPRETLMPGEEAAASLARWLVEDMNVEPRTAANVLRRCLRLLADRQLPAGEYALPELGDMEAIALDVLERTRRDPALQFAPAPQQRAARLSLPVDLLDRWTARFGFDRAEAIARAMGEPAPLDLRVNTIRMSRDECRAQLADERLDCELTPLSPDGLRMARKSNVFRTDLFEGGAFEVQDEASQLVARVLDPHPNWRVLDACAGGGGKALHLAALMKNRGDVFAHDTDGERLSAMRKRLRRAGVQNVRVLEPGKAGESGPYDAVLVDAPCLGLGTLRRNPDFAWRGALGTRLREVRELQDECLRMYAPMVKPGGVLVYATCSFELEETTERLAPLLAEGGGFEPAPLAPVLARQGIVGGPGGNAHDWLIAPDEHGTDGFYVARLKRR